MITISNVSIKKIIHSQHMFTICNGEYKKDKEIKEGIFVGNYFACKGEKIDFTGNWINHSKYGKQFKVYSFQKNKDLSEEDIKEYLMSAFKGVGKVRAEKIVNAFGKDSLEVVKQDYKKLVQIGIPKDIAETIHSEIIKDSVTNKLIRFLRPKGYSLTTINKIYEMYKEDAIKTIKSNPYKLSNDISGISFNMVDNLAFSLNYSYDSEIRIEGAVRETLLRQSQQGHCFLFIDELLTKIKQVLNYDKRITDNIIIKVLCHMSEYKEVIIENDTAIYLPMLYYAERYSSRKLSKIREQPSNIKLTQTPKEIIKKIEEEVGFKYAEQQRKAIIAGLTEKILILTGGPGTGKTTTVNGIIKAILLNNPKTKLQLAAPTGMAAKRMEQATNKTAKTIHRMLEYRPYGDKLECGKNAENPIKADVIILDEFSMTDILLLEKLLRAINTSTRLIIVGDVDQLPSVGPGNVLADLINSGVIKTIRLNTIFRQAETSPIVSNAYKINKSIYPEFNDKDFTLEVIQNEENVAKRIVDQYIKLINDESQTMDDIQILTPLRKKTFCGSNSLNKMIQDKINPSKKGKGEIKFAYSTFREGDKVMMTKNNYDKECFNGDTGYITKINKQGADATVVVKFDDREIKFVGREEILELELSYAITIHKSQGNEYKTVLVPMVMEHKVMLAKNLLYTGITRAKQNVHVFGTPEAIKTAIYNTKVSLRNSKLKEKLI